MDFWFGIQLLNTIFLVFFSSELSLNSAGGRWRQRHTRMFVVYLAVNLLVWLAGLLLSLTAHLAPTLTGLPVLLSAPIEFLFSLASGAAALLLHMQEKIFRCLGGPASLVCALMSTMLVVVVRKFHSMHASLSPLTASSIIVMWFLLTGALRVLWLVRLSDFELSDDFVEIVEKMIIVAICFGALSYWDVKRYNPGVSVRTFIGYIASSIAEALAVFPILCILAAIACLCVATLLEAFNLSTLWLNAPIVFVCIYLPFSSVYFFTKRRAIHGNRLPN